MAYRLTKLDLELLGETSTQNSNVVTCNNANEDTTTNGDKRSTMDNDPSVIGSTAFTVLGSQFTTSSEGNAEPAAPVSKKREASVDLNSGGSRPLKKKKQASAKSIALPQKTFPANKASRDRAKSSTSTTTTPEMKKEPSLEGTFGILRGFPTRKRESTGRQMRSFSGLVTFDTLGKGDTPGSKFITDAGEPIKSENQNVQASIEGGVDSEVERGASNLWSMLKTVDDAISDVEEDTTAATAPSTGKVNDSSQSSLTSVTSLSTRKSSFLSTVLNDPSMGNEKVAAPKRPSESIGTTNPIPSIHKPPPKRTFRRRQALNQSDPEATEDDTAAANLITPRKLKNPLTHPSPSSTTKPTTTTPNSTTPLTPPTRLCKTTGLPFSHSTTVRSTPRKRAPPLAEYVSDQIPIPTTWADATAADRKLIRMKEGGRASWDEIRRMWREETGLEVAASTLPNRYGRVRANLRGLGEGEHAILLQCLAEVEKVQKAEKWNRVAALMQTRGAGKYSGEYLLKQYSAGL